MKGRVVVLGQIFGAEAAALMVDGQLQDLLVAPDAVTPLAPGAICRGVVDRLMKGQGGVFLRLPDGARGFLRDKGGWREGQSLLVQISGVAEEGKAIPVSSRLLFRGRNVIVTPGAPRINVSRRIRDSERRESLTALAARELTGHQTPPGLILRSVAAWADATEISEEIARMLDLSAAICADSDGAPELLLDAPTPAESAYLDWSDPEPDSIDDAPDAFEHSGAAAAIETLLSPVVSLPGGGSAKIEQTSALIAVDVNTGADHSPAAGLKASIALARALPRELRLRGLGGQAVIDFAPMPKRDRGTLEQVLRAAFKSDGAEATLIGWTAMGLFELTRKRDRVPLARLAAGA